MNTRHIFALVAVAALSASASLPLAAASTNDQPIAYSVHTLIATSGGDVKIERGMYRGGVSHALRYKSHVELTPDVWLYTGFRANTDSEIAAGCETVIITFAHDRVADLRLANGRAVTVIAANLKKASSSVGNIASR